MTSPPPASNPYADHRGPLLARSFLPLALITLGVFFLLGNLVPERAHAGLVLLGLGAAFLIGRVTTARYGYAVPAGLLIAVGIYVSLPFIPPGQPTSSAGWFFVLLGLGFALVYLIGLRPGTVWPLFPAAVLVGLGLVLFGLGSLGPLASLSWIVSFWPIVLVLLGLWLMFRDPLPAVVRRPVGTLGGLVLLAYGVLAAASSVAAGGALARTGLAPSFGTSPFADTVTLDQPIGANQTLTVNNQSGHTSVRANADTSSVHVVATRHFSVAGQGPEVRLNPSGDGLYLDANTTFRGFFTGPSWVDYQIELPAGAQLRIQSSSGQIDVDGMAGAVHTSTTSGQINLSNLSGAADVQTSSGSVMLDNIAGEVTARTNSGRIKGTQLQHLRTAESSSGSINLEGVFTDASQIHTSSGSVELRLLPGSAVNVRVQTGSGGINTKGLTSLAGVSQQRNSLSGSVGSPAAGAALEIQTSSGSVTLGQ